MTLEILSDGAFPPEDATSPPVVSAFPVPCALDAGAILCVYRQGSGKHSSDGVLVAQRSEDEAASWSGQAMVFDGRERDPPEPVHAGAACLMRNGRICAFFTTVEATMPGTYVFSEEGTRLPQHFYVAESGDGGRTWRAPAEHRLEGAARNSCLGVRPIVRPDGRLLIPVEALGERGQSMVLAACSPDGGRTAGPSTVAAADPSGGIGYGDPRLSLLDDGAIVMLLWTYRQATEETLAVHRCIASDFGRTWSTPTSASAQSQIMAPLSLGSGKMIAASTVRTGRHGIRLWFPHDRGESWDRDSCVQMRDPYEERMLGMVCAPEDASGGQGGTIWSALPGFTFGYPDLLRLEANTFLLTSLPPWRPSPACARAGTRSRRPGRKPGSDRLRSTSCSCTGPSRNRRAP